MANQYKNKVIYGGNVLIDLTGDTVTADKVASGLKFHDKTGAVLTGTNTYDADTSDADAVAAEILLNKTAYVNGNKLTGTMPNRGAIAETITAVGQVVNPAQGYHDGSGTVQIAATEKAKIIASNIRQGVTILGVEGTMSGTEDVTAQSKTVTPTTSQQTITPDTGYNYLSQVVVNAISYVETDNSAGGVTVTIAG